MLKRLKLKNVGPAPELEIEFARRVNLITGDNGLGKSFILDVAWWALTGTWAGYPVRPEPAVAEGAEIGWDIGNGSKISSFELIAQQWSSEIRMTKRIEIKSKIILYANPDGGFSIFDFYKNTSMMGGLFVNHDGLRLSSSNVWNGLQEKNDYSFNGMIRDWASWQKENGDAFRQFCSVLAHLSPTTSEKDRLKPGRLTRISLSDVRDMPTLQMPYGKEVPIVHASAAMRRIVALAYLLVWAWQEHVQAAMLFNEPPTRHITLLIDEIEAHLHPAWQRRVLRALMGVAEALLGTDQVEVQIIAVTHSPLLLASMEPVFDPELDALWMFDLVGDQVKLTRDRWRLRGDANAWLTSEVFDLKQTTSPEAEQAMEQATAAINRPGVSHDELRQHHERLARLLRTTDPFWVRWVYQAEKRGLVL